MKDKELADELLAKQLISDESHRKVIEREENPILSLHWELRTLLYLGVTMLSTGLGIIVYQNIDTIGHQVILGFIALACAGCFFYCFKIGKPYFSGKIEHENPFFDYVLLLGCLLFLTFEGYVQYQYNVFGRNTTRLLWFPRYSFYSWHIASITLVFFQWLLQVWPLG